MSPQSPSHRRLFSRVLPPPRDVTHTGPLADHSTTLAGRRYALAADIQTIPGLPTAPGYLNVDIDVETGEIDGLF